MKCTHYECQCLKAAKLAAMGLILEAIVVHKDNEAVNCNKVE